MGAPIGNNNAAKAKVWSAAIERALDRREPANERIKAIDELADKLIEQCYDGHLSALQELGNRLDGKPAQAVNLEHSGTIRQTHEHTVVSETERRITEMFGERVEETTTPPLPN